ncbi:hypothetical protein MIND_00671800 [Mycena indigotica]|uniref:Peptidase M28 domain-containing protein n=1 Tax=Mycena indigotica TaxID=2126181 RepID=A0A8H6SK32_9AGAR|nr:uncharacterized protein MIND_00671800 [Mycena indigotica]KAF7301078.1 hypothetical protein MIND_00671800 [Mycena indigotica]
MLVDILVGRLALAFKLACLFAFGTLVDSKSNSARIDARLSDLEKQVLKDRLFQTNLRGPRWTGNENQNVLTSLVAEAMEGAGLDVDTIDYQFYRWDPRWWSLSLTLTNGSTIGIPTTGYWPYSGSTSLAGVTAPLVDVGTFGLLPNSDGDPSTLDFTHIASDGGTIVFFDNPSPTRNYSEPGYHLLGTSRNIPSAAIPELGNLTNPHWQSSKTLNWTELHQRGVVAAISSWVNTSDENAALQFLPNDGSPGDGSSPNSYQVPALYVGNSTGKMIRNLLANGGVSNATVVLNAPDVLAQTQTVIGHLDGAAADESDDTIILYTHSDGPSIIEENGPLLLLTIAEHFARYPQPILNMSLDFVITTGHMSGHHLNESAWMRDYPDILANARFAVSVEHFGAIEWKDDFSSPTMMPIYRATGALEPIWTMANESKASGPLHESYLNAFDASPSPLRMALLAPEHLDGSRSMWYGVGGSAILGHSSIPTIGIIPQPDYLWAASTDGGWSRLDMDALMAQMDVMLSLIQKLDARYVPLAH